MLTLSWSLPCSTVAAAQQPNIIMMVADDAGYSDFGFMDALTGKQTEFLTPNLDALAQQSAVFRQGYVTESVCSVSRAGFLTGKYQERFGFEIQINNVNSPWDGMPVEETMLQERMKQLGYDTGAIGKWHLGVEEVKSPWNQGVDEFYGMLSGQSVYFGDTSHPDFKVRRDATPIDWRNEPSFNNIPPDPILGRHLTDAFGDEASAFVANHATDADPFFLYVPFTSPHSPYDLAKEQDLALFDDTSLTGNRKNIAALTYAMDRAIGNIMARVEDPNGDGDTSDSIADNTMVVFFVDNGGRVPVSNHNNFPLRGYKAQDFEGGIRVPFMFSGPGVTPGVFDEMVSTMDLYPTFVEAAGGANTTGTEGVDLMPFLSGAQDGPVHEALFWRSTENRFAIRKGDWKLVKGGYSDPISLFRLNPDGTGETVDLQQQYPEVFEELAVDFVNWEVTLQKATYSEITTVNRFDRLRLINDGTPRINWRSGPKWTNADDDAQVVEFYPWDAYANLTIAIDPSNDYSFTTYNNIGRAVSNTPAVVNQQHIPSPPRFEETMLNELVFDRPFTGASKQGAFISGFPLMFVNSLDGRSPRITLNSPKQSSADFTFHLDT
ncbi:MAG: sulfatase-like hydrolase/transferase, partial [Planctomycetales bacterium]|nr:sulfatase-like hydrolase/transferase [Planctomycetales bacterium]